MAKIINLKEWKINQDFKKLSSMCLETEREIKKLFIYEFGYEESIKFENIVNKWLRLTGKKQ